MILNILSTPHNQQLCSYDHPLEIQLSYVCMSLNCDDENRLCCLKCLIEHHRSHINLCIHVNSTNQFLMNSIRILEDSFDIQYDQNDNFQLFQQFFKKKLIKLKRAIIKINNIQSLLQYIDDIIFAYNIHILMKQFISGCHQIIEKQLFFSTIDEIFTLNQKLYLDELQYNAEILKSQFYYEECIKCCENYLNLQVASQILLLKAQCLHMMNDLDEAEKALTEIQNNNFQNQKSLSLMILLIESQQKKIFNNLQINFSIIEQNTIHLLIGKQILIQKKYKQALQIFDAQIGEDYLLYFAITYKGLCYFYLGQYSEAQECCDKALQIYPKYYAVLFLKYLLLMRQNQANEAKKIILQNFNSHDQAIIKSNQFNYFQNENNYPQLSQIINQQIQQVNGQRYIQQIKQIQNDDLENLYNQGLEYQKNQKYDEAIEIFQKGISLDEQNEKFWKQKIITQFLQQQISEVDISIQMYLSMNPQNREIQNVRNQFKFFQYFYLTLEPNFKINEINTKTQDLEELYEEGFKCIQGKFYSKALEIYSLICSKDPNFEEAQLKKIYTLIILKRFSEANLILEKLFKSERCYLQALQMKGISLFEQGKYEQALAIFQQVESEDPNFVFVKFFQGHCYYKMKKYHQAKNIYLNLYQKTNCSLQQQSYLIRYFKTISALKYKFHDIQSEANINFLDLMQQDQCADLVILYIFIISGNQEIDQVLACEFGLKIFEKFINCQIFKTKLSEVYLKLQHPDMAKALCSQVLSLNPIYLPAVHLTIKMLGTEDLNYEQYLQIALMMNQNILDEDFILELQLAELEEYEPKMFIPELHTIQVNAFYQLNCYF